VRSHSALQCSFQRQSAQAETGSGVVAGRSRRNASAGVGRYLREPHGEAGAVAQLQVRRLGGDALHRGEEVRVERQLQDVLGVGSAFKFGVHDLVGEAAERGRSLDPLEEIRVPAPRAAEQRPLEYDVGARMQGLGRRLDRSLQRQAVLLHLDDGAAGRLQSREVGELVLVALALEQFGLLAVCGGAQVAHLHVAQVERRRVTTALEPHEV
jgi:hypothetical protein